MDGSLKPPTRYGKEWKKVAGTVQTRSVVQTRTHAQKFFQKLHKRMAVGASLEEALAATAEDDSDLEVSGSVGPSLFSVLFVLFGGNV